MKAQQKFDKVMHEFGQGTLESHGQAVTDQKQALAIAFSEARKVDPVYKMEDGGRAKPFAFKEGDQVRVAKIITSLNTEKKGKAGYISRAIGRRAYVVSFVDGTASVFTTDELELMPDEMGEGGSISQLEKDIRQELKNLSKEVYDYANLPELTEKNYYMEYKHEGGSTKLSYRISNGFDHYKGAPLYQVVGIDNDYVGEWHKDKADADKELADLSGESRMVDGGTAGKLANIYAKGTAKQLWDAWNEKERSHFLIDHAGQFFELMGDDYNKSAKAYNITFDTLPAPIRKEVVIHHAMGMYGNGGGISTFWDSTKKHGKAAWDKSKELAGKGYDKTKKGYQKAKAYTDQKNHDKKKNIALDVLDETRANSDTKDQSRILNAASNIVEDQYADGGKVDDRMYYFMEDDLKKLEKAIEENDKEEIDRFFSYWNGHNGHIKSLAPKKGSDRMYNFLKDDLEKLEKAISESNKEEVERFFSYWGYHLKSLKMATGGSAGESVYIDFLNKKKGFQKDRKYFDTYEDAVKWGKSNFERFDPDMIKYTMATGGSVSGRDWSDTSDQTLNDLIESLSLARGTTPANERLVQKQLADAKAEKARRNANGKQSPAKRKLQDRINTLKQSMISANNVAQRSIQKRIDKLQAQVDYNPTAKQRAQDNQGRFALDVPAKYSKAIYKKLWSMKIMPRIHKLGSTASIVVSSRNNLDKAYKVYSDLSLEKVPALAKISRKL